MGENVCSVFTNVPVLTHKKMMKKIATLFILVLSVSVILSCKKDKIEFRSDFEKSFRAWQKFKVESRNNYSYTAPSYSWTGSSSETIIIVNDGKVTGRKYIAKARRDDPSQAIYVVEEWTEDSLTLNSHQSGASTLTLDQVYDMAKNNFLVKRADAKISFEAKNNGLISSAGFIDDNCADDCFRGFTITAIQKLSN
jgi:hypothetical protein